MYFVLLFIISSDFNLLFLLESYKYSYIKKYRTYLGQIKYSMERFNFLLIVINKNTKIRGFLRRTKKNFNFISILSGLLKKEI